MRFSETTSKGPPADMGRKAEIPITEANYVVLDTELTGLDRKKDAIVSIGAVKMVGGRIDMGRTFYQLVNPGRDMGTAAVVIHEITPTEILEKPAIDEVMKKFLEFCGDDILIGHHISIDLAFINREAIRAAGRAVPNLALDTLVMVETGGFAGTSRIQTTMPPNRSITSSTRSPRTWASQCRAPTTL